MRDEVLKKVMIRGIHHANKNKIELDVRDADNKELKLILTADDALALASNWEAVIAFINNLPGEK